MGQAWLLLSVRVLFWRINGKTKFFLPGARRRRGPWKYRFVTFFERTEKSLWLAIKLWRLGDRIIGLSRTTKADMPSYIDI
jgi:hypothetical protein